MKLSWESNKLQKIVGNVFYDAYERIKRKSIFVGCDLSNTVLVGDNPSNYEFVDCKMDNFRFINHDDYAKDKPRFDLDNVYYNRAKSFLDSNNNEKKFNYEPSKATFKIPLSIEITENNWVDVCPYCKSKNIKRFD